jgi:transcriptional regulator of aromatic amino acid metabolism
MRLEVFCEDRLGLTRELLDLLVLRGIDLRASILTLLAEFISTSPSWISPASAA